MFKPQQSQHVLPEAPVCPRYICGWDPHADSSQSYCGCARALMLSGRSRTEFSLCWGQWSTEGNAVESSVRTFSPPSVDSLQPARDDACGKVTSKQEWSRRGRRWAVPTHADIGQVQRGGPVRTKTNMKSRSQDQSLSDSRELDRSYDPLTGRSLSSSHPFLKKKHYGKLGCLLTWLTCALMQFCFGSLTLSKIHKMSFKNAWILSHHLCPAAAVHQCGWFTSRLQSLTFVNLTVMWYSTEMTFSLLEPVDCHKNSEKNWGNADCVITGCIMQVMSTGNKHIWRWMIPFLPFLRCCSEQM